MRAFLSVLQSFHSRPADRFRRLLPLRRVWGSSLVAALGFSVLLSSGCSQTERFETQQGESFCGHVIPGPFVRHGFAPDVRMRLHLHPDDTADCGDVSTSDGRFSSSPLVWYPEVSHDALQLIDLGDGRVRTLLYGISTKRGDAATVFVSLLEGGGVEVRVLQGVPSRSSDSEAGGNYLFGLFVLEKQAGTCGF